MALQGLRTLAWMLSNVKCSISSELRSKEQNEKNKWIKNRQNYPSPGCPGLVKVLFILSSSKLYHILITINGKNSLSKDRDIPCHL